MASLLRVDGSWPGSITLTAGFFRARARPWNDSFADPMIRLDRGGAEFLRLVSERLAEMGARSVYSPALYPDSTSVWRRAGFETFAELAVMERVLTRSGERALQSVSIPDMPDWEAVLRVDRAAFEGFWRMSGLGLQEAYETSRTTTLLETSVDGEMAGYAIVGNQWGVSYLHRIAVHPDHAGNGLGRALLEAAARWGRANGAKSMVLNVRDVNQRAQRLYQRCSFSHTGTRLSVLRDLPGDLLD